MDQIIFAMAELFALLPDGASLTVLAGHLTFHGDGSFVSSAELSAIAWPA